MLTSRFDEALAFAARLHQTQCRKGTGIPYISHLLAVASLALENGGGETEAIGALLHDAIEDQAKGYPGGASALRSEIERRFGPEVLAIVEGCTDAETFPKPPWKERKMAYIAHLETCTSPVLLVSCCDKLHNARAILSDYRSVGEELWGRFNAGREEILWYYRSLAEVFSRRLDLPVAGELAGVVSILDQLCAVPTTVVES